MGTIDIWLLALTLLDNGYKCSTEKLIVETPNIVDQPIPVTSTVARPDRKGDTIPRPSTVAM